MRGKGFQGLLGTLTVSWTPDFHVLRCMAAWFVRMSASCGTDSAHTAQPAPAQRSTFRGGGHGEAS